MNNIYKQMIVMLFSVAFLAIVAIIVLSSSASASSVENDLYQMESEIDNLREQQMAAEESNDKFRTIVAFIIIFTAFVALVNHSNKNATPDYADWDADDHDPYEFMEGCRPDATTDTPETSQYMEDEADYDYDNFMNKWQQISSDRTGRK